MNVPQIHVGAAVIRLDPHVFKGVGMLPYIRSVTDICQTITERVDGFLVLGSIFPVDIIRYGPVRRRIVPVQVYPANIFLV